MSDFHDFDEVEQARASGRPRRGTGRGPGLLVSTAAVAIALAITLGWAVITLTARTPAPAAAQAAPASVIQLSATGEQTGGSTTGAPLASPAEAVGAKLGPSVVNIKVSATDPSSGQTLSGEGSGIIFSSDGYIVTNNHVVTADETTNAAKLSVTLATGDILPATVIGTDPLTDLAVIKVTPKNPLPAAQFDGAQAIVGEYAIAIGSPLGYANSVTLGIVSGTGRSIDQTTGQDALAYVDLIQTDAAISPGNSGGALANANGQVIGVNVAYLPPGETGAENVGFAIPAETASKVAEQLIKTGKATHVYLGVETQDVTPDLRQQFNLSLSAGALVAEVTPNGPAAQAGIRQGDVITKIDSTVVNSGSDVIAVLRGKNPGDKIEINIVRAGTAQVVPVVVQERPPGA